MNCCGFRAVPGLLRHGALCTGMERRHFDANTGNQLSVPGLYGSASFCGRLRKAGVRILRRQLRRSGDRGALRGEGRKGGGSPAGGRGNQTECAVRGWGRVGHLHSFRGLGRGGRRHAGIRLPQLRRGAYLRRNHGGHLLPLLRQPHRGAGAILRTAAAGFHHSLQAEQGRCRQGPEKPL
mgnify:CR=1 FL=1